MPRKGELPGNREYSAIHDGLLVSTPTELWKSCATEAIDKQMSSIQDPWQRDRTSHRVPYFLSWDAVELGNGSRTGGQKQCFVRVLGPDFLAQRLISTLGI